MSANTLHIKYVTTLALTNCHDKNKILIVRRPLDDDFPGMWELPAISSDERKDPKTAANHIGSHKLGASLNLGCKLASGHKSRGEYLMHMDLYFTFMLGTPGVSSKMGIHSPGAIYTDWQWASPLSLEQSTKKGSLCCKLLLSVTEYGPLS